MDPFNLARFRDGADPRAEEGYIHCGPNGSGTLREDDP